MALKCLMCGLKVGSRTELGRHKVTAHQIHKPHSCQYCGKRFSGKTNLVMHIRLHTGEKPYCCSSCGKDYADYSNCVKHIKTQHHGAASLIRRKFCYVCYQHFNSRQEYLDHACYKELGGQLGGSSPATTSSGRGRPKTKNAVAALALPKNLLEELDGLEAEDTSEVMHDDDDLQYFDARIASNETFDEFREYGDFVDDPMVTNASATEISYGVALPTMAKASGHNAVTKKHSTASSNVSSLLQMQEEAVTQLVSSIYAAQQQQQASDARPSAFNFSLPNVPGPASNSANVSSGSGTAASGERYTTKNPNKFLLNRPPSTPHSLASPGATSRLANSSTLLAEDAFACERYIKAEAADNSMNVEDAQKDDAPASAVHLSNGLSDGFSPGPANNTAAYFTAGLDPYNGSLESPASSLAECTSSSNGSRHNNAGGGGSGAKPPCCDIDRKLRDLESYMNVKFNRLSQIMQDIDQKLTAILSNQTTSNGTETWHFTIEKRQNATSS